MPVSMKAPTSPVSGIDQLRIEFSGALIMPGDAEYDAARSVWNRMIDAPGAYRPLHMHYRRGRRRQLCARTRWRRLSAAENSGCWRSL